jgi:hypothetical protein
MLGLTDRDRQEIRSGRNKAIGERHATFLFWAPVWGRLLLIGALALGVALVVVEAVETWNGGLGATVSDSWPLWLLGLAFVGMFVALGFPRSPRRRGRGRRRR